MSAQYEYEFCLLHVCVVCLLSRKEVVWLRLGVYMFVIYHHSVSVSHCNSIIVISVSPHDFYCLSWKREPFYVALHEVSSFFLFKGLWWGFFVISGRTNKLTRL